jgi:SAM-dependent methyltransferase
MSALRPRPIHHLSDPARFDRVVERYESVRRLEGRLLDPETVRRLPEVDAKEPHAGEWRTRADSMARLERWMERAGCRGPVLDVGCGPGWMTARLARRFEAALGVDVVPSELERGAEAFADVMGLEFAVADIFEDEIPSGPFGLVLAASSAQYFPSLRGLVERLLALVRDDGWVVVMDTPLYRREEIPAAAERTRDYYRQLGVSGAEGGYHHHCLDEVRDLAPEVLYDPRGPVHRLARWLGSVRSPFPMVGFRRSRAS